MSIIDTVTEAVSQAETPSGGVAVAVAAAGVGIAVAGIYGIYRTGKFITRKITEAAIKRKLRTVMENETVAQAAAEASGPATPEQA